MVKSTGKVVDLKEPPLTGGLSLLNLLLALVVGVGLWVSPVAAQVSISNDQLKQLGVKNPPGFWPIQLGADGLVLYAAEDLPPGTRLGAVARIWVLHFGSDSRLRDARSYLLKGMPARDQCCLAPDASGMVFLTRDGASFWYLDFASGAVEEFVESGMGRTVFKGEPLAIWEHEGVLWTIGYPLDRYGYRGKHSLAQVDYSKHQKEALRISDLDIDAVVDKLGEIVVGRWISPDLGFFGISKRSGEEVFVWRKGGVESLGKFGRINGFFAIGNTLVFTAEEHGSGKTSLVIYDAESHKKWVRSKGGWYLSYPFVSKNGRAVVLTGQREGSQRVSVLSAFRDDDFKLRWLEGLKDLPRGVIRVAPNGKYMIYRTPRKLIHAELLP